MERQQSTQSNTKVTSLDKLVKIRRDFMREKLTGISDKPYHFELLGTINGVTYINDAASADVDSTWLALEKVKTPTIWIAGGVDRGNNYAMLEPLVHEKVKAIVCLGNYSNRIFDAFLNTGVQIIVSAADMHEAVVSAAGLAQSGSTVLLSPACASYDLFESADDRGNQFNTAVIQVTQQLK